MIKTLLTGAALFLAGLAGYAQTQDSIPKQVVRYAADKFPFTRLINTEFRYDAPYDFEPQMNGTDLPTGRVTQLYQARVSANVNFIKSKQWIFSTGLFYNFIHAEVEGGSFDPAQQTNDLHYFAAGLSVTHFSKLFGKMAIFSVSAIPTGGSEGFERITGIASATLVLKANTTTKMTLGLLAIVDPASIVPVVPTFSYEHRFKSGWIIDIIMPQRVFMKKDMFKDGRLSLGTELSTTSFYLNGFNNSSKTYMFNQMELMNGLTYEHYFLKGFVATLKTGYKYIASSRISEINEPFNDYIYKVKSDGTFYVNMGLSYNL
ncbi:MAG: DUF6268 family outer membrane beta-barrel protein [Bacteroidota bacterium]